LQAGLHVLRLLPELCRLFLIRPKKRPANGLFCEQPMIKVPVRHPLMRNRVLAALLLFVCLSGPRIAAAQAPAAASPTQDVTGQPPDVREKVKGIFAAYDHTDTPGCVVGVSLKGTEVLRAAYGMADLEHDVPLTPDSVLEAGSIAKQFTAAAILLLAQQGKLSLSDPVRKYIPELPDSAKLITIDHLLHHTSGLRDWGAVVDAAGWPRTTRAYSNEQVLDIVTHQKSLNYKPGDEWSYTNTGYNLLAILVERVSGKSLAEFTHENIFVPMGMKSTSWRDDFQRVVPGRAIAYERSGNAERQLMPFENAYGNGGLLTTVDDLLRWNSRFASSAIGGLGLGSTGLASPGFIQSELEPARLNDGRTLFYAAGLFITEHDHQREISHSGATAGYRAWLGFYPEQQLSVAVLCNEAEANTTTLAHQVAALYLPATQPVTPARELPADAEGLYESRRDHIAIALVRKEGKLLLNGTAPVQVVSATAFRLSPDGSTYELKTDASGKVTGMRILLMGYEADTFDKVEPAAPTLAETMTLVGDYMSDEAEATLQIEFTPRGLEMHQRPGEVYMLKPTYKDGFESSLGSIRFLRDAAGHVTGLSLGNSRMWDLRFERVKEHEATR
jgi:CubicO group peptidase (beta-lactamase class C family)